MTDSVASERIDVARDRACRALAKQARRFPDLLFDAVETEGLESRDAAFAHAIYDAALRRWLTITHLIERGMNRPFDELEPRMKAALLAGGAQILFMERVPDHAAIDESVEWAKRNIRPGAGKLANAALRRLAELRTDQRRERYTDQRDEIPLSAGGALALTDDALPEDPMARLAIATSHPIGLLRTWSGLMPLREARDLAMHNVALPPVILNTAHAREALPQNTADSALLTAHIAPGHHVFHGDHAALISLLGARPDIWVQDPASSLAVMSVSDLSPNVVVDLCAGRGTKTRQLASAFPEAEIVATDVDAARFAELKNAFASSKRVAVVPFDSVGRWRERADLVLIDAPCSNTGVLARRVEARYRADERRTEGLAGVQRQIIADSIPLLARGAGRSGMILYSTCSLDPRENEQQAEWAARWHDLGAKRIHRRRPGGGPGEAPEQYSDGSFAVLLT